MSQETKQPAFVDAQVKEQESIQIHETSTFPFIIVQKNDEFRIAVGDTYVSQEVFNTIEEAYDYLEKPTWEMIVNFICLTNQKFKEYENELNR